MAAQNDTPPAPDIGLSGAQEHVYTTDARSWDKLKIFARQNRRKPTPAEAVLWSLLRGKQAGSKFRRQHAIEGYIVDFVCLDAKLIIEADGEVHSEAGQAEYDAGRTHNLLALGYQVLRFTNEQVLSSPQVVLRLIKQALREQPANSHSQPAPRITGAPSFLERGSGGEVFHPNFAPPPACLPPASFATNQYVRHAHRCPVRTTHRRPPRPQAVLRLRQFPAYAGRNHRPHPRG